MNFKKKLLLFLIVFGLLIALGLFQRGNLFMGATLSYYVFCLLAIIVCWKLQAGILSIVSTLALSIVAAVFVANLIDNGGAILNREVYIFPGLLSVVYACMGVLSGVLLYRKVNRYWGLLCMLSMSLFFVGKGRWVFDKWMHYVSFKNFGSIEPKELNFVWEMQHEGRTLTNGSLQDTFLVMDFWNSSCPICLREMPVWDTLSKSSKQFPIAIVPVFIPSPRDTPNTAQAIFQKRNIKYLKAGIGSRALNDNFAVAAYPTIIILKNNHKLFEGNKDEAIAWLQKNKLLP